jgi:hypothetical protein
MKKLYTILFLLILSGCNIVPKVPSFSGFGSKKAPVVETQAVPEVNVAAAIASQAAKDAFEKAVQVEQKATEDKKKMEEEYAKTKAEMQKAYQDLRNKDLENFAKISEINYGVYHVTQEKKKVDINTTIAHLRSKEIMMRTDILTDAKKAEIQKEVAEEKIIKESLQKSIDGLYIKYKATIELAVNQKSLLDDAEALIVTKEKEKTALKEANRLQIEKLESDKKAEIEKLKQDAADQVRLLKEAQKEQLVQRLIYVLGGLGILFIVLGVLMRSISFILSAVMFLGLAYIAASVPMWIVAVSAVVSLLVSALIPKLGKKKDTTEK